jgi:hypothetical protein
MNAPPRRRRQHSGRPLYPCAGCHVSHGGCTARWIAWGEACCATCDHVVAERTVTP